MKRLIYCLDGTWNTDDAAIPATNVAKLHRAVASSDSRGIRQISHYLQGIASTAGERAQFLRGAVGYGVSERICRTYALLMEEFEPGDEIYLFGFSRGAFEARSLAGLIDLFGIGKRGQPFDVDEAWALYRTAEAKRSETALRELRSAAHFPVRIKCLGVWDTVGNVGNPIFSRGFAARRQAFHDTRWSGVADTGLHALAIDEMRGTFRPILWTLPTGTQLPAHQHVEQVWFAGTHADIGGGWRESGLSDVSLHWMAERSRTLCGLALDDQKLAEASRPDPLGPQHFSASGIVFAVSRLFPFIRLLRQRLSVIPSIRRAIVGTWRTGKVPRGQTPINESVHESAAERLGQKVIELHHDHARVITYCPRALKGLVRERPADKQAVADTPRRAKIFTVHGTFAYETTWDDWDAEDAPERAADTRFFINRLSALLRERGITLGPDDHSQYNWSGGNSHAERRNAAIGLKKHIMNVLAEDEKRHGKGYYDGVYIVSHSHGGTISRLAINLWDKAHDYYDPKRSATDDEFKHDDTCQVCKRSRNGIVGPGTTARPDGVITFGSPFVTFEKRKGGLLAAWLGAWVFRAFAIAFVALLGASAYANANDISEIAVPGFVLTWMRLVWPIAIVWLLASYLPGLISPLVQRRLGEGPQLDAFNAALLGIKLVVSALLAVYLVAMVSGWWTGAGGWLRATQWLPFVENVTLQTCLAWLTLVGVSWLLVVTLPGRFLRWLRREVVPLASRLPTKFDPRADRAVKYLSYHTPGDEAGLGLAFFGLVTWVVQTFALALACMLALGVLLLPFVALDSLLQLFFGKGLLYPFGISALSDNPVERLRFVDLMDLLTLLPSAALSLFGGYEYATLRSLPNASDIAWWVPLSIVLTLLIMFLLLMPVLLVLVGLSYLTAIWLRRSGLVFGGEGMAWNLANRIAATRRPSANTIMRTMLLTPEAWWRKEIAHCYYYKSERVISDLAQSIANWAKLEATPGVPIGRWVATAATWLIVMVTTLSVFSSSIPMASGMNSLALWMAPKGDNVASSNPSAKECPAQSGNEEAAALAPATGDRQNLRRIRGIDAGIEERLNALGVTRYDQMAAWTCSEIRTVNRSFDGFEGRIERELWREQAKQLSEGGVPAYAREFDAAEAAKAAAEAANAPPVVVKDGNRWCLSKPHGVAIKAVASGGGRSGTDLGADAQPKWEAEVSKKYGADWANWSGSSGKECWGGDCTVFAQVCKPRILECQGIGVAVSYEFELAPGLTQIATTQIQSTVLGDLKTKWSAEVQQKSGPEWISAEEIGRFDRPVQASCNAETQADAPTRHRCVFETAPCKDGPTPEITLRNDATDAEAAPQP